MEVVSINGQLREVIGKKDARNLRREEQVPCVVYGGEENIHFYTDRKSFKDLIFTSDAHLVHINVDGKEVQAVLKATQYHPVSDEILHADFMQVFPDKEVLLQIPVHLTGSAIGVRNGGNLRHSLRRLQVSALPQDLPSAIVIDITNMRIGNTQTVADIQEGKSFKILNSERAVVVAVLTSRNAIDEDEDEEEGEGEGAEGETADAPAAEAAE
jgi:large subunit ribosomal protein L25